MMQKEINEVVDNFQKSVSNDYFAGYMTSVSKQLLSRVDEKLRDEFLFQMKMLTKEIDN